MPWRANVPEVVSPLGEWGGELAPDRSYMPRTLQELLGAEADVVISVLSCKGLPQHTRPRLPLPGPFCALC